MVDIVIMAVTAWRENRGGGVPGMQSVINAITNRANRDKVSMYTECVRRLQFSSMTAVGDPELVLWPQDTDTLWLQALQMAQQAVNGTLADLTHGAVDYYAPKGLLAGRQDPVPFVLPDGTPVAFPKGWNRKALTFTAEIEGQLFFREE